MNTASVISESNGTHGHGPVEEAADDVAFCKRLLPEVSRTFALSVEALPEPLREPIRVAYLLCRIVDTVEDEPGLSQSARHALFDAFDVVLGDDESSPRHFSVAHRQHPVGHHGDRTLCAESERVVRRFRALSPRQRAAIRPHILEMSTGMRGYTDRADIEGKLRLADLADLERYCYFVAGTVGNLLTELFEVACPSIDEAGRAMAKESAVAFGLGLQFVNILKDVAEDFPRGDCYIPRALATEHGFDLERVLDPAQRPAGLRVIGVLTARAREHLGAAARYSRAWPAADGQAVRLFCAVPLALAYATLWEVENGPNTLRDDAEPKVSRQTVFRIMADAAKAVGDDDAFDAFLRDCADGVYGESPRPCAQEERGSIPPISSVTVMSNGGQSSASEGPSEPFAHDGSGRAPRASDSRFHGKVLLTGSSGHLGANLVRRMVELGWDVRVLLRAGSNNQALDGLPVERVHGDVRQPHSLQRAVEGCRTVIHTAAMVSTIHGTEAHRREIFDTNVLGTRILLREAKAAGVERVVVTGSFSATGYDLDDPQAPASEERPVYPFPRTLPYARSKHLVEHECLRAVAEGQDVVVATSCAIVGPNDYKPSRMGQTLIDFSRGKLLAYVGGGFEFVASRDIAEGHLLALERGRRGQKYTIATEYLTFDDVMDIFEEVTGRPRPKLKLPAPVLGTIAEVTSAFMTTFFPNSTQLITPGAIDILRKQRRADTSKAQSELGFRPSSVRQAIHEAYDDFARRGLVAAGRTLRTS